MSDEIAAFIARVRADIETRRTRSYPPPRNDAETMEPLLKYLDAALKVVEAATTLRNNWGARMAAEPPYRRVSVRHADELEVALEKFGRAND